MGRRSLTSTKGGKFMNPTDQARKEARKKELKKNKKQRMAVRHAVLKGKDPQQIIEDLIKIDEMEFNVINAPPLSEKVLTDKRKKLLETLDRVELLYKKEDPDKLRVLKGMRAEYEQRRGELVRYFESVKQAEMVTPDEIPLPAPALPNSLQDIPMPTTEPPLHTGTRAISDLGGPRSILKKHPSSFFSGMQTVQTNKMTSGRLLASSEGEAGPGVPVGPPPPLSDCSDDEDTLEPVAEKNSRVSFKSSTSMTKKIPATQLQANPAPQVKSVTKEGTGSTKQLRFAPQPTTAKDEVLEFLQQLEKVHHKEQQQQPSVGGPQNIAPPSMPPMSVPPPSGMWSSGHGGSHTQFHHTPGDYVAGGLPPPPGTMPALPLRSGVPASAGGVHSRGGPTYHHHQQQPHSAHSGSSISAHSKATGSSSTLGKTTIQAKPQMRSLQQEVVKFVPSQLRRKAPSGAGAPTGSLSASLSADASVALSKRAGVGEGGLAQQALGVEVTESSKKPLPATKDDAYAQFMREMQGLI